MLDRWQKTEIELRRRQEGTSTRLLASKLVLFLCSAFCCLVVTQNGIPHGRQLIFFGGLEMLVDASIQFSLETDFIVANRFSNLLECLLTINAKAFGQPCQYTLLDMIFREKLHLYITATFNLKFFPVN